MYQIPKGIGCEQPYKEGMKGFGKEGCTGGKKVIGNGLGKIPNPEAPKIQ